MEAGKVIDTLNEIGFGIDIDSLESYIIDYKQARIVSDLSKYKYNYDILEKILRQIKGNSVAFGIETSIRQVELDQDDRLFRHTIKPETIYGSGDTKRIKSLKERIDKCEDGLAALISLANIQGINISAVYKYGGLAYANLIGDNHKYTDVTDILYGELPLSIDELENYELVELRGKVTIKEYHIQNISKHIETSVMRCIRCNIHGDSLNVIFNDIDIDKNNKIPFKNEWEKLEFMRRIGLNTATHSLLRGVDSDSVETALTKLNNYYMDNSTYKNDGYELRIEDNNKLITSIIYDTINIDSSQLFTSTVKAFKAETNELRIVSTRCNDDTVIDNVKVDDIYTLEELGISIGKKIVFNVIEGVGILNKEYTRSIT